MNADDCQKLLDNGWRIELYANDLGSYTARAKHPQRKSVVTDDFTPTKALYRLTEKATTGRIVDAKDQSQTDSERLLSAARSLLALFDTDPTLYLPDDDLLRMHVDWLRDAAGKMNAV